MVDLISRLSEIRSRYNCFNESEEPYYRALSEAIKLLSGQADGDTISRKAAIDEIDEWIKAFLENGHKESAADASLIQDGIIQLPSAQPEMVRCKDCKYQRKGQNECEAWNLCGYRPWQYTPITDEHFCSYAERRTE